MSDQEEKASEVTGKSMNALPVLPLRDVVVYPHMVISSFCRTRQINKST